jgi:DnaJ-class molecular chaperone
MPNIDTEEWKISCRLEFVPKITWKEVECSKCGGQGRTNMHFGSLDDPETCWDCHGSGIKSIQERAWTNPPKVPQELIDHMQKAYLEWKLK